jgi:hypothetical protein
MVLELGAGRELAEAVLAGGQLVHPFSHLWVLLHVVHQPAEHAHTVNILPSIEICICIVLTLE